VAKGDEKEETDTTKLQARADLDVVESRFYLFFPFRFPGRRAIERFFGPLPLAESIMP
jgi:hypothetical protein